MPSRDRILMEYFDGERPSGATDDVRRLLEPRDERRLAEWTQIGDVVRAVTERGDGEFCDIALPKDTVRFSTTSSRGNGTMAGSWYSSFEWSL